MDDLARLDQLNRLADGLPATCPLLARIELARAALRTWILARIELEAALPPPIAPRAPERPSARRPRLQGRQAAAAA